MAAVLDDTAMADSGIVQGAKIEDEAAVIACVDGGAPREHAQFVCKADVKAAAHNARAHDIVGHFGFP